MKKILIFGYTMDVGGAEKELSDFINLFDNYCEVDLYLINKKGDLLFTLSDKVNVKQFTNNKLSYVLFRFLPFYRKRIINKIANSKEYKYAIGYMEGRSATWVCDIKREIRKYAWIHVDVKKFDIGISDYEAKKSYSKMDKIICVSNSVKKSFCEKFDIDKEKVEVIYNFVNKKEILEKANEIEVKNNVFTFINVAKMRKEKRHDRLIEAAKYLSDKGYDFKLQLIGDGPESLKIKQMTKDYNLNGKVELLGLKTNPYPYIKGADCFVLSSEIEGYGIVIKEALLLKKRIISTDVKGPREILCDGKYGIIVYEADNLKYEMEKMLLNNFDYKYLDESIKKYQFDDEKIIKQILKLIDL